MAQLIALLYETGALRRRYEVIHRSLCGFPTDRILGSFKRTARAPIPTPLEELRAIRSQLQRTRDALTSLDEEAAQIRQGVEIRRTLSAYLAALTESSVRLEALYRGGIDGEPGRERDRNRLRIAYDDAIQNHKRLGTRLNDLIASL